MKKRYRKTSILKSDTHRKAKIARAVKEQLERMRSGVDTRAAGEGDGWLWVPSYLRTRYGANERTAVVYAKEWISIREFLDLRGITGPDMLDRQAAYDYCDWRSSQKKHKSGKLVSKNTALMELKLLALLMDEAVKMGIAEANPIRRLGIKSVDPAMKPEISTEEEAMIRQSLRSEPDWMAIAFHVGISTGLRWGNCAIRADQVRWPLDDILIDKPKGGRKREFAIPIYDSVRSELEAMRDAGRRALFTVPPKDLEIIGLVWRRFFDRIGLPGHCFHCTRVTFISRGMRAGIPEHVMMRMVNHGSRLVSRIYQRWTHEDVRRYAALLAPAPLADDATARSPK